MEKRANILASLFIGTKGSETMANLRQAKTDDDIKRLGVNSLKTAYHELALDYNHLINLDYIYCPHCGEWKSAKTFYSSNTTVDGIEHYGCKECILNECTDLDPKGKIRTDNKQKTINMFRKLDWYFDEPVYDAQVQNVAEGTNERTRTSATQQFITVIRSLPNWKGLTFSNSKLVDADSDTGVSETAKITQKTLKAAKKRFGNSYSDEDLMFLENEYQDWITRYECNTKAQETIFERLAFKKWEINKATRANQSTKDLDKTYTDLLSSINILPRQNANNGISDSLTFGQLIEKWESSRPIPEADPEFKDVNHIGKYIKIWFKGALARSLGIDNGYSQEYDDYIKQYSVTKSENTEDDTSDDIYKSIFGGDIE